MEELQEPGAEGLWEGVKGKIGGWFREGTDKRE